MSKISVKFWENVIYTILQQRLQTAHFVKRCQVTLKHERQIQIFGTQTKINRAIFPGIWHMIERETKPVKASKGYETTSSFKLNTPGT